MEKQVLYKKHQEISFTQNLHTMINNILSLKVQPIQITYTLSKIGIKNKSFNFNMNFSKKNQNLCENLWNFYFFY